MNNSYITIIKENRTALGRKRVPLNQNECTADFRAGVPFKQNLQFKKEYEEFCNNREKENSLTEWNERGKRSTNKDQ